VVIRFPLVHPASISPYGSVQVGDLVKIKAMAGQLFTIPGARPVVGPAVTAGGDPGASSSPGSSATP
jgi:hypothetical protein